MRPTRRRAGAAADIVTRVTDKSYRVILWGPGSIGSELLTAIIDHRDDLDIVGVKVYSEAKNGVDAGTLVDRDPIGVAATTDDDAILALDADCVIYTPRNGDLDEVCRLLASGKNVATTVFLFYPPRLPEADRKRLEAACRDGDSTFHASGINPGNLSGVLPLALSGMSRTIDKITLQERADMTLYDSTEISFGNMKFGEPLDVIDPDVDEYLRDMKAMFVEQIWLLGDALNAGLDEVTVDIEALPAEQDHQIFDRLLKAGTTAGQRWNMVGRRNGAAARRDRDAVDGRQRIPGALARTRARLDADHRRGPVHARPLPHPGQLHPQREHRRARPGRQHRHRDAGPQRRARGVRRAPGLRHQRHAAADPQRNGLQEPARATLNPQLRRRVAEQTRSLAGRVLTRADLVLRWSSPRIHWLPWADLGSHLTKKSLRALRKRKTTHVRSVSAVHT